ncbi:MAG: ABC transporter substrate-binding protein [Dehalococcoidia bacterium]
MGEDNYWRRFASKRFSRRRLINGSLAAGAGLAAAAAVGCGGGDDDEEPESPEESGEEAADTPPAEPRGTFVSVYYSLDTLDPYAGLFNYQGMLSGISMWNSLVTVSPSADDEPFATELQPELAETLPEQPDDLTYIFKLRPDVKFHDKEPVNGRTLDAEDVVLSMQKAADFATDFFVGDVKLQIESARAIDDNTVEIKTKSPYVGFLVNFGDPVWFPIVAKEVLDEAADNPIGTGPYMLDKVEPGVRVRLVGNPNYFDPSVGHYEAHEHQMSDDPADWVARVVAGEVDYMRYPPFGGGDAVRQGNGDIEVVEFLRDLQFYYLLNNNQTPLEDQRVRQALALALPSHDEIIAAAFEGTGLSHGVIPSTNEFAVDIDELPYVNKQDIEMSKQLLEAAGHPDGFQLETIASADYHQASDANLLIADAFGKIGVTVNRTDVPYAAEAAAQTSGDYTTDILWAFRSNDADRYLSIYLPNHPLGGTAGWGNDEISKLIDDQRGEFDPESRREILRNLQLALAEQQYILYLPTPGDTEFHRKSTRNWRTSTIEWGTLRWATLNSFAT